MSLRCGVHFISIFFPIFSPLPSNFFIFSAFLFYQRINKKRKRVYSTRILHAKCVQHACSSFFYLFKLRVRYLNSQHESDKYKSYWVRNMNGFTIRIDSISVQISLTRAQQNGFHLIIQWKVLWNWTILFLFLFNRSNDMRKWKHYVNQKMRQWYKKK